MLGKRVVNNILGKKQIRKDRRSRNQSFEDDFDNDFQTVYVVYSVDGANSLTNDAYSEEGVFNTINEAHKYIDKYLADYDCVIQEEMR